MIKKITFLYILFSLHFSFAQKTEVGVITLKVNSEFKNFCKKNAIETVQFQQLVETFKISKVERMFDQIPFQNKEKTLKSDISLLYKIHYAPEVNQKELLFQLGKLKCIEYAEPLYIYEILYAPNDPSSDSITGSQGQLKMHKAYRAWDITKGDSSILVAISDLGINLNHIDLQKTIHKNLLDTIDGIDNDNDGLVDNFLGYDFGDNDNNPTETSNHGTLVAGCISADTDNGIGIAGIGYHTRIVPLKVYGANFAGFESIVFAANKGYDIINLSWGCTNCYSQTLQDIIDYAVLDKNLVVVAAAGNTDADIFWYPASYDNVLSVSGLNSSFVKGTGISWNYSVDVMAKGNSVYSTSANGGYATVNGTSFAAPMASGGAALVKSVFPNYSAQQIMEQLRVTADSIYHIGTNATYQDKLGKGSLNLYKAVSDTLTPAIRNLRDYTETQTIFQNGDTVYITGDFINFLNPTKNLKIKLSSPSLNVQMINSSITAGTINTLDTFYNTSNVFSFKIISNPSVNKEIWLKFSYTDSSYTDFEYKKIIVNQDYINIHKNNLKLTVNSTGNIGYNVPNRTQGIGFSYKNFTNLLSESGLMIASDTFKVSNNLRITSLSLAQKFLSISSIKEVNSGIYSDFKATSQFWDTTTTNDFVGVNVEQNVYAWNSPPNDKYIILEYKITNRTTDTIPNLYAGIFADWEISKNGLDKAAWNHKEGFGYVYDAENKNIYTGIKPLLPYYGTYYAIENQATSVNSLEINNTFTDAEKYKTLSSIGTEKITSGENYTNGAGDVAHTVGNKIGRLAPNETKTVAYALMAGDSLSDLENAAHQAQLKYGTPILLGISPTVYDTTICVGTTANLNAFGGENYYVYYSENDFLVMDTILPHKTQPLYDTATYYISFGDSIIPNQKAALAVNTYRPEVQFVFSTDTLFLLDQTTVQLQNVSPKYSFWEWNYYTTEYSTLYNPTITYTTEGIYYATLTITDAANCSNSKTDSITVINAKKTLPPEGMKNSIENSLKVYPIPSSQNIVIEQTGNTLYPVEIYNSLGQKVYEENMLSNKKTIQISEFSTGVYSIKVNTQIIKFIKK